MSKYSILLVDDEELALVGIEQGVHWEKLNIENVYKADSMRKALEVIETNKIDIMVSDIEMPGGSGLELIRIVRQKYPEVICIFYTCHASFEYCQEAMRLGAVDYVLKPIPYGELESTLQNGLKQVQKGKNTRELENIWDNLTLQEAEKMQDSPVKKVKKIIMENLSVEMSREELAKQVYMSPDYLTKLFKKETGMSLSDYIIHKRILLAQKLLTSTNMSVVEIAQKAGFSYSSYFVRIFKKKVGKTPQQYRKDETGKE